MKTEGSSLNRSTVVLVIPIFGMMRLVISASIFSAKKSFISLHSIKLLKNFNELKTILSYSSSWDALEHNCHIYWQNPLIGYSTSSLYLLAYSKIASSAAPLHLNTFSSELTKPIICLRMAIQLPKLS